MNSMIMYTKGTFNNLPSCCIGTEQKKALRGTHSHLLGDKILEILNSEIQAEFPATENQEFNNFYKGRGYDKLTDEFWTTN